MTKDKWENLIKKSAEDANLIQWVEMKMWEYMEKPIHQRDPIETAMLIIKTIRASQRKDLMKKITTRIKKLDCHAQYLEGKRNNEIWDTAVDSAKLDILSDIEKMID